MGSYIVSVWIYLTLVQSSVCQNEEYSTPDYTPPEGLEVQYGDMIVPSLTEKNLIEGPACYRWPNGVVPYVHDGSIENFARINTAMNTWEKHTCVKFQDIGGNIFALFTQLHVKIRSSSRGCFSTVGRFCYFQANVIGMAPGCLTNDGISVHELGHTLGLYHEQSRVDRDEFVTIKGANIFPNSIHNFNIAHNTIPMTQINVPYDYYSVMHYGRLAFSKNGELTIVTKDDSVQNVIGGRIGPSFSDIKKINEAYKCAQNCPTNILCRLGNDCFVNSNCKCVCRDKAPTSKQYAPDDPQVEEDPIETPTTNCGGSIVFSIVGQSKAISPPMSGSTYVDNAYCIWTVRNNAFLLFTRVALAVHSHDVDPSCGDFISVNPNGGTGFNGVTKLCGSGSSTWIFPAFYTVSTGRDLSVLFVSDGNSGTFTGFSATVFTHL